MVPLLAVVLLLIPLAIVPRYFFYFDVTPKTVVLLLGTAAAAVCWAISRGGRVSRWFSVLMGGMAVSLAVSSAFSVNLHLSLGGSNWRFWGLIPQLAALAFAWLAAAGCANHPERSRIVLAGVVTGGIVTAVYGIAQYFGGDPLLDPRVYHVGEGVWAIVRPPSTLGHADYFGIWQLFVVFAGVALAGEHSRWKWPARVAVALSAIAILLSGTRAALVGAAAGGVFLALWRGVRWTRLASIAVLTVATAGAVFYISPAGALLRARVHWVLEEPAGGARLLLWRDALHMALARWPLGYGPETFTAAFAMHKSAELARAFPDFYYESPHNIVLDALVSQGVPGPALLLALAALAFLAAWKRRTDAFAGALAAGLAAMTVGGQFVCFTMPTALAFYVTIALLIALTPVPDRPVGRPWMRLAAVTPVSVAFTIFALQLVQSETALAGVRRDLEARLIGSAASRYAAVPPFGPGADLWYSRRLVQIAGSGADRAARVAAFQDAVTAARRATETDDAPFNAYYNLAAVYASQNDYVHTVACLRAAISHAPNWFKPRWMLAQVLAAGGHIAEAEQEAARAAWLDGGKHAEVTGTLRHIRATRASIEPQH
ncbi:MAG TPA: O-antigen ligase family protein [Bryobacteraceae bacterium]|nr:O-antigen ligase family protein [Bryobacteraceae bacterium]